MHPHTTHNNTSCLVLIYIYIHIHVYIYMFVYAHAHDVLQQLSSPTFSKMQAEVGGRLLGGSQQSILLTIYTILLL